MNLGLWGARMDNSGLGMQTWEFFNAMRPDKTMVVDISPLEHNPNRIMEQYPERYQSDHFGQTVTYIEGLPNEFDIRNFLADLDVVFIAESAYNMNFYAIAREMEVKTAVQYNYEFFDWNEASMYAANPPDMFIAPTTWNYEKVSKRCLEYKTKRDMDVKHVYLHCPVNRDKIPFRRIESATVFVHIAGRPAAEDRNGTKQFLEAIELANGDLTGLVYTQDKKLANDIKANYKNVKVKVNTNDYSDLYKKGSVLVLPRKYGGNCLPMNEALSAGMPVIMSNLSPQADFLPKDWLVNAHETDIKFAPRFPLPVFEVEPVELMIKMRLFKSYSASDMHDQNEKANQLAESISWYEMAPKYTEVLEALCQL